jgi:RND family efflux transporter MFP subunit
MAVTACNRGQQSVHSGCDHDHDHDHQNESVSGTGAHDREHDPDEIIILPEQARTAGIRVEIAEPAAFNMVIKTSGQVQAARGDEITVVASTDGVIAFSRPLTEGAAVKQGEPLLYISSKNMAEGDPVLKAGLTFQVAEKEYRRAESLLKDSLVSQREYEQALLNYQTAKVTRDALAKSRTEKGISVTAGIGGYIRNILVSEGEYVNAGQPLATVSQNRRLQLRADVPEKYYADLPYITSANFRTPYNNKLYQLSELKGRLVSYGRSTDAASFYIPVTFELDNTGNIAQGTFVEVYLLLSASKKLISVPIQALVEEQGLYFVYLQTGEDSYKKREVKIEEDNGRDVPVAAGIEPGDRVVVEGAIHVKLAGNASAIPEHGHSH